MNLVIEYQSTCILIMSDCATEEFTFIALDEDNPKIKKWSTWWKVLTNEDVENIIKELLEGDYYDVEYEIHLYRKSSLYSLLLMNREV